MPCFANSPTLCSTWQRPQIPRPPQTESMSTPSFRAASRTVVPASNRPRRPDGVKITSGSAVIAGSGPSAAGRHDGFGPGDALRWLGARAAPVDPAAPGLALRRGDAEPADPSGGVLVVALEDVGRHHRAPHAFRDRVGDRAG